MTANGFRGEQFRTITQDLFRSGYDVHLTTGVSRMGEGLGLAIKVEDGASRAKHAVALHLLEQLDWLTPITLEDLKRQFLVPGEGLELAVSGELRFDAATA